MIVPFIAVTNGSTVVTDDEVRAALTPLQHQVNYHFRPYWNAGCRLGFAPKGGGIPEKSWHLEILDTSDKKGALGYHTTKDGQPLLRVFAKDDQEHDRPWTVTASHEILETLADPWVCSCWFVKDGDKEEFIGIEVCDAVGGDAYAYEVQDSGVIVTNFVLPNWYIPGSKPNYDFKGYCTSPLEVLVGGFVSRFTTSTGWKYTRADGSEIDFKADRLTPVSQQRMEDRKEGGASRQIDQVDGREE